MKTKNIDWSLYSSSAVGSEIVNIGHTPPVTVSDLQVRRRTAGFFNRQADDLIQNVENVITVVVATNIPSTVACTVDTGGARFAVRVDSALAPIPEVRITEEDAVAAIGPIQLQVFAKGPVHYSRREGSRPSGVFYIVDELSSRCVRVDVHELSSTSDGRLTPDQLINQLIQAEEATYEG